MAASEAARAEARLAAVRIELARQVSTPSPPRADRAASPAAREHELARMKAKFMDGETAGTDLADRLRFAHQQAGKPSLDTLGSSVGYSKATLSKVFNGKMQPAWALVRKLAVEFRVPQSVLTQEWHPLWIAADTYRQKGRGPSMGVTESPATGAELAAAGPVGHTCPKCGAWVVDNTRHVGWHMAMEPGGAAPDAESIEGWNQESSEYKLLREALGTDPAP
ncbi:helix-turn-helix domain-containing protein [Paractinoplanes toevensis]|uniref:HTH cro/C1-type domain-containing protein n=1 Tax=Paractinoplanes toevensis TaxID=571911 RepID=A0A919TBT3_9ACTN|nr:helix-turn-helix transcriptional regulator [Actinoplanes toevensis]GIM92533.1 hypothetical protein Ato02nite_043260 [Actinoplanes toevensis]